MRGSTAFAAMALCLVAISSGVSAAGPGRGVPQAASPVQTLDSAGEGRRAYLKFNCYGCHGMFAAGAMGPDIIGKERHDVSEAVMQGAEGGMPAYRAIVTDTDISNLTAYLASIGTPREPLFMDWWKKVPPK